ncbi:MAG: glycosyltransferase [Bacteroidota bacterium]
MLAELLFAFAVAYFIKMFIFGIAVFRAQYPSDPHYRPSVAIIIAARNEEHNIGRCLSSIVSLSYPRHLLEVVVVDDRSTDRTGVIVREFTQQFNHIRLVTAAPSTGNLRGKTNAVTQGIEASKGEILLFTDADCAVPIRWVEETVKYYTNGIGIVAGFTALRNTNWFEAIQALDWFILFSVAAATIRLKHPVTAVGNNLSVKRAAYEKVGGYRSIPFSVTEDYALFHAITTHTTYQARFPVDPRTLVESEPCKRWEDLYRQKKRWFTGGRGMDVKSLLLFAIPYVLNLLLIVCVFFGASMAMLVSGVLKVSVDLLLVYPSLRRFGRLELVRYFLLFELYYILYVLIFPIIVLFGNEVMWKERKFAE